MVIGKELRIEMWELGGWGLGIGDWGLGIRIDEIDGIGSQELSQELGVGN